MASCFTGSNSSNAEREITREVNWLELPLDLTANILQRVGIIDRMKSVCLVCPLWCIIFKYPLMWRTINLNYLADVITFLEYSPLQMLKICCYAVKRSRGHLEDINIDSFGNNALLECLAECASHLRRLRLTDCFGRISNEGLSKFAKKLPLLEELDLSASSVSANTIEVFGRCCPLLKSLKFTDKYFMEYESCDDEVFAIAKTMPGLRHIMIFGSRMTNDGALAILDGCPLLKFLELQYCWNLKLSGRLKTRYFEQFNPSQLPSEYLDNDSIIGIEKKCLTFKFSE